MSRERERERERESKEEKSFFVPTLLTVPSNRKGGKIYKIMVIALLFIS